MIAAKRHNHKQTHFALWQTPPYFYCHCGPSSTTYVKLIALSFALRAPYVGFLEMNAARLLMEAEDICSPLESTQA